MRRRWNRCLSADSKLRNCTLSSCQSACLAMGEQRGLASDRQPAEDSAKSSSAWTQGSKGFTHRPAAAASTRSWTVMGIVAGHSQEMGQA